MYWSTITTEWEWLWRYFDVVPDSVNDGSATPITMTYTLEISDELKDRLDDHLEEGESYEEFITELVAIYETEGEFLQEGYSE
jgi:hypothetical protein